jgi:hypothetical protein
MKSMSRGLFGTDTRRTGGRSNRTCLALLVVALGVGLSGCSGGGGGGGSSDSSAADLEVRTTDVNGVPIGGAVVSVMAGNVRRQATTSADGSASFRGLPNREATVSVTAAGFEPESGSIRLQAGPEPPYWGVVLRATGAWAVGRAVVLGTRMVERAGDGSAMTFSVDLAVIGENSEALQTLTSSDFTVDQIDCGWGGPRDCASDATGNATGSGGNFRPDGPAQSFSLQPPSVRHPYLVGVLAERSTAVTDWNARVPALKSFFTMLGGNDSAGLASVQTEDRGATLAVLGPFTSDGRTYLDAIDQLARPAGSPPAMLEILLESIRRAAAADAGQVTGPERTVLVLATPWMSTSDIDATTALARQLGVRISTVVQGNYGFPEMAVRTGGFAVDVADPRQLGMVFGVMDRLLAGAMPYYRMQFRLVGSPGTFVSGGNAKVRLRIRVPSSIPSNGVGTSLDVAIP